MPIAENQIRVVPDFFPRAGAMRAAFEARFASARVQDRQRFIWDYWHVPGQYTYVRTFAKWLFSSELMSAFLHHLRSWGQEHLGCNTITEPWLSFYVDGCGQELHTDRLHGPWAFVVSLTRWDERRFTGGETTLAGRALLNYWQSGGHRQPLEYDTMIELQPARFNQLLVFDARIPHGVRRVEGTRDPAESRLVLHGWFKPPSLIVGGGVGRGAAEEMAVSAGRHWQALMGDYDDLAGWLILRRDFAGGPEGAAVHVLTNTLVSTGARGDSVRCVTEAMCAMLRTVPLPGLAQFGSVTFPFRADAAGAA